MDLFQILMQRSYTDTVKLSGNYHAAQLYKRLINRPHHSLSKDKLGVDG